MKTRFDRVFEKMKYHQEHGHLYLDNGFNRINQYLFGVQRATQYLVGAQSYSGKTALVDSMFVTNPFQFIKSHHNINKLSLKIFYYSLEIDPDRKTNKFIAKYLFDKYEIYTDTNYLLSKQAKNRVSNEVLDKVFEAKSHFDELDDLITYRQFNINPTKVYVDLKNYAIANGSFYSEKGVKVDINNEKEREFVSYYKANNEKEFVIIIVDHLGLLKKQEGLSKKDNIDKLGEYLVDARNFYGYSPVLVSQFNRNLQGSDRIQTDTLEPKELDFKDTSSSFENSDVVMGLFTPSLFRLPEYKGYNINKMKDNFKGLSLLKNRDGEADKIFGCYSLGAIGEFKELDMPDKITLSDYDNMSRTFKELNKQYIKKDE